MLLCPHVWRIHSTFTWHNVHLSLFVRDLLTINIYLSSCFYKALLIWFLGFGLIYIISYGKHCMRLITFDFLLYFPLAFLGPFKTLGSYSYTNFVIHTFLDTSVYMFIFLQLEYDLCFCSVHLQDELVVLLEGLLLVVGVLLLFVELLAHVHDQLLHGGNFSKLFLILSMIDLVF